MNRIVLLLTMLSTAAIASAQPATTTSPPQTPDPAQPMSTIDPSVSPTPPPATEDDKKPKEPQRGDFNAGGQARFPSGPDEMGQYASFNWVAVDLKARYYLLKQVTLDANVPLAIIHPDSFGGGAEPSTFGGFTLTLDARMKAPRMPGMKYDTTVGLTLTGAYMKEGAMLLSDKDFPLFLGDLKPGFGVGLVTKIKISSLLDFSLVPTFAYQSGSAESLQAIQVPLALQIGLGSLVKLNLELGVFTGDDFSIRPSNNGRLASGASLDIKISHLLIHAGAGFASLLTADSGFYPTIKDSFYVELNGKYVK